MAISYRHHPNPPLFSLNQTSCSSFLGEVKLCPALNFRCRSQKVRIFVRLRAHTHSLPSPKTLADATTTQSSSVFGSTRSATVLIEPRALALQSNPQGGGGEFGKRGGHRAH